MLEWIELENFGIHKRLKIKLGNKITTITGPSSSGKSTIFKALRVLFHNRPLNAERIFNHKHEKKNKFCISAKINNFILKRKGKIYTLKNLKTKTVETFKAIGSEIPEPILKVINLGDINWQKQITNSHFLILDTPAQRTKILNSVTGMDDSEKLIQALNKKINSTKTIHKILLEQKSECEGISKQLILSKELCFKAEKLLSFESEISIKIEEIKELKNLLGKIESKKSNIKNTDMINSYLKKIDSLEEYQKEINKKEKEISELNSLLKKIKKIDIVDLSSTGTWIKSLEELEEISKFLNITSSSIDFLKSQLEKIEVLENDIEQDKEEIKKLEDQLHSLLKKGGICPLCSQRIK